MPEFEYLQDNEWEFTEKIDGTNIRIIFDGEKISFAGRTNKSRIPEELSLRLKCKFDVQEMMVKCGDIRSRFGCFLAEGIVARPTIELKTRNG